jgi:hypothetical protein
MRLLLLALLLVRPAQSTPPPAPPIPEFSEAALTAHARFLASPLLRGREIGSEGEALAALYVATRLEGLGVPPLPSGEREIGVPAPDGFLQAGQTLRLIRGRATRNVFGFVRGSDPALRDEVVVLGTHVDHLGEGFPGAEDNASGVAVVLEISAALAKSPESLGRSVLLAFFGGEELGMVGSRAFVEKPPPGIDRSRVVAMVNVDMIGRPFVDQKALALPLSLLRIDPKRSIGVVGTKGRAAFKDVVKHACAEAGLAVYAPEDFPGPIAAVLEETTRERGDNWPFEQAGIPALFYGSGESDDYHATTDTLDKLDPALMARRARAVFGTVVALSRAPLGE